MGNQASSSAPPEQGCALEGAWVATRKSEWRNRNLGTPHAVRAAMPQTKMTYTSAGKGSGWVGELRVKVSAWTLAPGHFSSTAKVPALFWRADDGNMTLLEDGTLEVRYPSNGITEYWKRASAAPRSAPRSVPATSTASRPLMLLLRKVDSLGITWHWALGVGSSPTPSIYEVGGVDNAIIGPNGVVCGKLVMSVSSAKATSASVVGTKMSQFQGYVELPGRSTTRTDTMIEQFCREWRARHPVYNLSGPNCQTFTEDLHIFLTGKNLEFHKVGDLKRGPEASAGVVWLR